MVTKSDYALKTVAAQQTVAHLTCAGNQFRLFGANPSFDRDIKDALSKTYLVG